ncbi:EthD family reductase [Nocardioides bruguierae]|uniref:EthD family reductase n=1 Tax=Nocardioides bruguierae TaxID=2945102 RepID=UPI00202173D7|nr:EthD family reductase [Nocardioides bruguierae]MCL8026890.1 EthD family reductase [Nocardioides bruguierae]
MYTIAILTQRKAGLSREEFLEHYRTTHFALSSSLPGLVSYQQHAAAHGADAWTDPESDTEFDALSVYTFESVEAGRAAFAGPEGQAVDADTGTFIDWDSVRFFPGQQIQRFDR